MTRAKHMVAGFNHNVRHAGKLYHVQTEDSGVQNPRITTHLFLGGNIVASKSASYAELLEADDLATVVRAMMEEQHKDILRRLVAGAYDGEAAAARAYQPGELADEAPPPAEPHAPPARSVAPSRPSAAPAPPPPVPVRAPPTPAAPVRANAPAQPPPMPPIISAPRAVPRPGSAPALTPPPVLRRQTTEALRAVAAVPPTAGAAAPRPAAPPPRPASLPVALEAPAGAAPGEEGGGERTLDEVILSYLAEDLEGRK